MATNGSLLSSGWYSSDYKEYVRLEFAWEVSSTSTADNTSTIYWELRGHRQGSGYVKSGAFKVVIDGDTVYSKGTDYRIELRKGTLIANGRKTLTHNPDGTRSFAVSIEGGIYTYAVNCTGSDTFELNTIPRASTITSAGNVTLGNPCNIVWTPLASSLRYKLKFSLGSWNYTTGVIHPNQTSAYTYSGYTIPIEVANQITGGYTGTMTVTLYTYSDSAATKQIGSEDSETFKVTVPTSEAPAVTMSLSPVHSLPAAFDGIYIQGISRVKATISATPEHGATILYYDMTVEGKTYGAADGYTSGYLTNPGEVSVVGHAVDSREYGGYAEKSVTVIPYANPKIQNVTAKRCDESGNLTDSGKYLKITATRNYYPVVSNGVQKNFCQIRYRYKTEGASDYSGWVTILAANDLSADAVVTTPLLDGNLLTTTSYRVEVQAIDDVGNYAQSVVIVSTEGVYWHRDGAKNALGLGKRNERDNALDSAWDFYMNGRKVTGLADPVDDTDAVTLKYLREYINARLAELTSG
jgi:hypothetical protein